MSITITLPTGEKVRSASRRRYVVIDKFGDNKAFIYYRTDVLTRARGAAARGRVVYDQVERRFVA